MITHQQGRQIVKIAALITFMVIVASFMSSCEKKGACTCTASDSGRVVSVTVKGVEISEADCSQGSYSAGSLTVDCTTK